MYKLQPDDIQSMLRDASRVLTQPQDRETVQRLYQSMLVTEPDQWDKRLIAPILAKAGKLHEAEIVAYDIDVRWQRAEALLRMAETIFDGGDEGQALGLLHAAALEATKGMESENANDCLDAASVLGDVALVHAQRGDTKDAHELVAKIEDPTRRERALESLAEFASAQAVVETTAGSGGTAKPPKVGAGKVGTAKPAAAKKPAKKSKGK